MSLRQDPLLGEVVKGFIQGVCNQGVLRLSTSRGFPKTPLFSNSFELTSFQSFGRTNGPNGLGHCTVPRDSERLSSISYVRGLCKMRSGYTFFVKYTGRQVCCVKPFMS